MIVGPTGFVTVTGTGMWKAPPLPQNFDFNLMLWTFEAAARVHLTSLTGFYTSTVIVPPIVVPWSGALLITLP